MPKKNWIDFEAIKENVSIENILRHYGLLDEFTRKGDQLYGCCPIHQGTRKSQFSVSLAKNAFKCFSADCGAKGNQIDFVAYMQNIEFREAAELIQDWFGVEPKEKPGKPKDKRSRGVQKLVKKSKRAETIKVDEETKENKPLTFELNLDPKVPYLESRGLSHETISCFGLGLCNRGSMKDRIAIPIHDHEGKLVAYAGRWSGKDSEIPDGEGKYKLPGGFHKSLVVYNLQRIPKGTRQVILVEGFFSVFWLHQCGYKNVVSTMGSSMSGEQLQLLKDRFVGVQVFFDGDEAGETGALEVGSMLYASGVWCKMLKCPKGKQPDHLSHEELQPLIG